MVDQADKLRQVIDNLKLRQAQSGFTSQNAFRKHAKVIAVTSGKGGVGKTNITINLAISLSDMGFKVLVLDADLGLANVDVMLGKTPRFTLLDVIRKEKSIIEVLEEGPNSIKFISGGSGMEELANLDKVQVEGFINSIGLLDEIFDIIIIDTGAGISDNVMRFVVAADEVLVIATPEPASVTDAYALIKVLSGRDRKKVIKVIVNRAETANEAKDILKKLSIVSEKFLSVNLIPAGYVLYDEIVIKAAKIQQPFSLAYPKSNAAKNIRELSRGFVDNKVYSRTSESTGIKSFVNKLVSFMKVH